MEASYAPAILLIIFLIVLIVLALTAWRGNQTSNLAPDSVPDPVPSLTPNSKSEPTSNVIHVYYCTEVPQEAAAGDGLVYLQDNPGVTGHYLMDDVQLIPFADAPELQNKLGTYIQGGGKIAVLTSGSELVEAVLPLLSANPEFELLNMYSTTPFPGSYPNLFRFAFSDDVTFPYVIDVVPNTAIVYYDPDYVWAANSAQYFGQNGYTIIPYGSTGTLPESVPYLVIATVLTPNLIDLVPASCPKLYGLDGSIFFPFTGTTSTKAAAMQFECVQYFPPVTSPLIADVQQQVGEDFSYIFPCALDGIGYARNYLNGFSNNTIQTTTSGFSGSLIFTNGSRTYGNLEWYTYTTSGWNLTSTTLINTNGACTVTPTVTPGMP